MGLFRSSQLFNPLEWVWNLLADGLPVPGTGEPSVLLCKKLTHILAKANAHEFAKKRAMLYAINSGKSNKTVRLPLGFR